MRRIAWLVVAVGMAVGCGGPQPPPFKPVLDTKAFMEQILDPSTDVIWGSAGQIITSAGTEDLRPTTEEGWLNVRNHAAIVAESGNLLMMVPRARDGDEWMRISQALVDVGVQAIRAAEAKDADRLFQVGGDIYNVCTNCHSKYIIENGQ
jgi:hypothetical protein